MLICRDCGALFEQAAILIERHGLDKPPYEELLACPHCRSTDIHHAHRCDICGEWIHGCYIITADGNHICDECYTQHDAEED